MAGLQDRIHLAQAGLSGYALFHAYNSITKLREWEPVGEEAAKYTEAAKQDLYKTRTTQTSAAIAVWTPR